jgi:hypothetical protein
MSSVESDWTTPHRGGHPREGTNHMGFRDKNEGCEDRPEGYYVDSGTYPVMPKSRDLTTEQIYQVLDSITPELHNAALDQFSRIRPGA